MDTRTYIATLKKLGLGAHSKRTAAALGMSVSGIQKIAGEATAVPGPVGRLLEMYLRHGLPREYREPAGGEPVAD